MVADALCVLSTHPTSTFSLQVMWDAADGVGLILTTGGAVDYTFTPGNATTYATTNANIITLTGSTGNPAVCSGLGPFMLQCCALLLSSTK